jgi:hypothetical protein
MQQSTRQGEIMKGSFPDGSTFEFPAAEIARQGANRYLELAKAYKNVSMIFGKGRRVMSVIAGEPGWKTRIKRLLDDQWVPGGFLYTEDGDDITILHKLSFPRFTNGVDGPTGKMQDEILDVAAEKLTARLGMKPLGGGEA